MYRKIVHIMILSVSLIASSIAFGLDTSANQAIGKVIIASGNVSAIGSDNSSRNITRGVDVFNGDRIVTQDNGKAQIRLNDNSVFSIRPNSEVKIVDYHYNKAKPNTNKSIIELMKGGLRAITGKIAKETPSSYQVKTNVAVIGVRGTDFTALLENADNKNQLFVTSWDGIVTITNSAGSISIGKGESFKNALVSSSSSAPQGLAEPAPGIVGCPAP